MNSYDRDNAPSQKRIRRKMNGKRISKMLRNKPHVKFPIHSNEILILGDLRDCVLDGLDLSGVEFYGCRLNGTSFRGANLQGVKFIGCFASEQGAPMDLRDCLWQDTQVIDSHLHYLSEELTQSWQWQPEVAEACWDTLSENSATRYRAAEKLGNLGDPVVALLLAYLLDDHGDHWEVCIGSLRALGELRQEQFPYLDQQLMEWMFYCLGDNNHMIRDEARVQYKYLRPSYDVLKACVDRMISDSVLEQMAGLEAASRICVLNRDYSRMVESQRLSELIQSEDETIREKAIYLLGGLDVKLLQEPIPISVIRTLLRDSDEEARATAVWTLQQLDEFDLKEAEIALYDPSEYVRELARQLFYEYLKNHPPGPS
jgi:hypothetical protein